MEDRGMGLSYIDIDYETFMYNQSKPKGCLLVWDIEELK